jgi:hypothetical protein
MYYRRQRVTSLCRKIHLQIIGKVSMIDLKLNRTYILSCRKLMMEVQYTYW